jgi:hypothetical protein
VGRVVVPGSVVGSREGSRVSKAAVGVSVSIVEVGDSVITVGFDVSSAPTVGANVPATGGGSVGESVDTVMVGYPVCSIIGSDAGGAWGAACGVTWGAACGADAGAG